MGIPNKEIEEIAKKIAMESLFQYLFNRKKIKTQHIVLKRIFPDELPIYSALQGLQTSFGQTLWETLAKEISTRNGYILKNPNDVIGQPVGELDDTVEKLRSSWEYSRKLPNNPINLVDYLHALNNLTLQSFPTHFNPLQGGEGIDIAISKGGFDYCFDIKTVQPDKKNGTSFNSTLMYWYTYYWLQHKTDNLRAYFAFPYDPTANGWWQTFGTRVYPLNTNDALVGDDFWSLLSGTQDTLRSIEAGFDQLTSPAFKKIYGAALRTRDNETDIKLIEITRNVQISLPKNTNFNQLGRRSKLNWICTVCNAQFKASIPSFKKNITPCPNLFSH